MSSRRDVEVELEFLPTELGGRGTAVRSGYRPQLYYDGHDWDASHEYPDAEQVCPGEHVRAYLTCMSPQFHVGKLVPGKAVLFREGQRVVAFGTVTRIIDLPHAAHFARVQESLESYYQALGLAAEQEVSSQGQALCRAELAQAFSLRQHLKETGDVPDLQNFLSRQAALTSALSTPPDGMLRSLEALQAAAAR
jgi:hypothetical protein